MYEGGLRIPFIIYFPELFGFRRVVNTISYLADMFPTIVKILNAECTTALDGASLEFSGETAAVTDPVRLLY